MSENKELINENKDYDKIEFKSNPLNIRPLKILIDEAYSYVLTINRICIFKSIYDIIYLVYLKNESTIISYNVIENKRTCEIKEAHDESITSFRYHFDNINKRDLII